MRPYVFVFLCLLTTSGMAQIRQLPTEIGMAYGSYQSLDNQLNTSEYISRIAGETIDFKAFGEARWFTNNRQIRNYEVIGAKRIFQSKNLRRELHIGCKVAGQFQHRTIFIGTKETLVEEMVIDHKTGEFLQSYTFETVALSELNDYLNVSPYAFSRFLLNDHLSINTSFAAGTLVPLRTGIQESKYAGTLSKHFMGEELINEDKYYIGDLNFVWHQAQYQPRFRFDATVNLEIKPFDTKPYYFSIGSVLGQQISPSNGDNFAYSGIRLGVQSQF